MYAIGLKGCKKEEKIFKKVSPFKIKHLRKLTYFEPSGHGLISIYDVEKYISKRCGNQTVKMKIYFFCKSGWKINQNTQERVDMRLILPKP